MENLDRKTVVGFGSEWSRFDQSRLDQEEATAYADRYFSLVAWDDFGSGFSAMDVGCGSGRWARFVAPRAGRLVVVDASKVALEVAERNLADMRNCSFVHASVADLPEADESFDLVYSLGVLHHLPDTQAAIEACVRKVRPGGRFLVYLYYRFDNRPTWFRVLWRISDFLRQVIARLPFQIKRVVTDGIAVVVYLPLARCAALLERRGHRIDTFPLSYYRAASFYTMRTDALDRFGTRLERRFTRSEVERMLSHAGLVDVRFRESDPYWCAIGTKPPIGQGEV